MIGGELWPALTTHLQPAIVNLRLQNRVGPDGFEPLHDFDHFAAADHDADGAPGGVFQAVDGGAVEAGGDLLGFGELRAGQVVFQQRLAAGNDDAFQPADDAVGQLASRRAWFWISTVS